MRELFKKACGNAALMALPAGLIIVPVREAQAQWVVSDPGTEANTFISHVTQLLQYIKEAQAALAAVQHLQIVTREVQQLAIHPSTHILQDLSTITRVVRMSQGLAQNLAQMDNTFRTQFAPYSPSPFTDYAAKYGTWSATALNAIHAAANTAGYQGNLLDNEQGFMQQMSNLIQQPNGQDQSLQITNALGLETVAQLQKLRALLMQNSASNGAFMTTQLNTQAAAQQAQTNAFNAVTIQADPRTW